MKTKQHNLSLLICLQDFDSRNHTRGDAVNAVFDIIEKVKGAVISKGGKLRAFTYDNTPNYDTNIDGNTPSLRFDIVTPYPCKAELVCICYQIDQPSWEGPKTVGMIEFRVDLSDEPKQSGATGPDYTELCPKCGRCVGDHRPFCPAKH